MRRKDRYISNGALIGGGVAIFGDILFQWLENLEKGKKFTWNNYDGIRTLRNGVIGAGVGAGVGYLAYEEVLIKESEDIFQSRTYLKKILTIENIKNSPNLLTKLNARRQKVKDIIISEFGEKLASKPEDVGSFFKRTAINSNYDLDIIIPFKKQSFSTLQDMFELVGEKLDMQFYKDAELTKQRRTLGLTFNIDSQEVHFDIIPGREVNDYKTERKLSLFVNPNGIWDKGSSTITHVRLEKESLFNKSKVRNTIKLLKVYRDRNNINLSSTIIEQCTLKALDISMYGERSDIENLVNSMFYIAEKLENERLPDSSNPNKNLNEKLSYNERLYIINRLKKDAINIENNERCLMEVFEIY